MKKILTMTLALCLAIAASATNYALWVAGKQVTDANRTDILGNGQMRLEFSDGGYALILDRLRYEPTESMDYFVNTVNSGGLANAERVYPLKIVLCGYNWIEAEGNKSNPLIKTAFNLDGDTRFVGTGTLRVYAQNYGIDLQKWREKSTLSFDEGYVDIATNNYNCIQTDDRSRLELNDATLSMNAHHKKGPYNDRKTSVIHYSDQGYMKYSQDGVKLDNHSYRYSSYGGNVHEGWYYGLCPIKTVYDINELNTQHQLFTEAQSRKAEWVKQGSGRWKYSLEKNTWSLEDVNYTSQAPELHLLREGMVINVSGDCHIKVDKLVLGGSVWFTGSGTLTIETKYGCEFRDAYRRNPENPYVLKIGSQVHVNITASSDYAIQASYPQNFIVSQNGGGTSELKVKGYKGATKRFGYYEYWINDYLKREQLTWLPEGVTRNDNGELVRRDGSSTANIEVLIRVPKKYINFAFVNFNIEEEYDVDESNYYDLTHIPLVTVSNGGYARYIPTTKVFEFKNVTINGSFYPGNGNTLRMTGTNTINGELKFMDLVIRGEGSKQSSKLTVNEGIRCYSEYNIVNLRIYNMTMDIKSRTDGIGLGATDFLACGTVQWINSTGTITGNKSAVKYLRSFVWDGCYLNSPLDAKFDNWEGQSCYDHDIHNGEFLDSNGNPVKSVTFGANDASVPPLTANLVLTGVGSQTISASDERTSINLLSNFNGQLSLQCNIKGNGSTDAIITRNGQYVGYRSQDQIKNGTTYTFSIDVNSLSAPKTGKVNVGLRNSDGDTLYTNYVNYRVPREMKISGPLYYSTYKHDWKWVEAGESTTALVFEGDTVWCDIAESDHACYPTIKTAKSLGLTDGYYEYYQSNLSLDITPDHKKYPVKFYGDLDHTWRIAYNDVPCGEELTAANMPSTIPTVLGTDFLGWVLEGTTEPIYTNEELETWVVTDTTNFFALYSAEITGGDNDQKDLDYGIVVADIPVTDLNADDILRDGEYDEKTGSYLNPSASYDPATRTITLRDYEFTGEQPLTITSDEPQTTVVLEGTNTMEITDVNYIIGLFTKNPEGTVTFTGSGSLDVTGEFAPLVSEGNLVIDQTTVTVHETSGIFIAATIMAVHDLTFRSCHVTMDGSNMAAAAERILLDGDAEIATEDVVINNNIGKFVYTKDADATSPSGLIVPKYVEIVGLPLGITHTHAGETNLQKILYNGQLYIQREGRLYNAQGAQVK